MIFSRTMRPSDYELLQAEVDYVDRIQEIIGPPHPMQNIHRRWEYGLALKAFLHVLSRRTLGSEISVADFGCATGALSPLLLNLGCYVSMYEIWEYGDDSLKAKDQMQKIPRLPRAGFEMINRALGHLGPADRRRFDAAFCISTFEHIENELAAFTDFLDSVQPRGIAFLTVDFAEDQEDHYQLKEIRHRMYNASAMQRLIEYARDAFHGDFVVLGGSTDYGFSEERRMVYDYGFASLAFERLR